MTDIRERLARVLVMVQTDGSSDPEEWLIPGDIEAMDERGLNLADAILSDLDAQGLVIVPREPTREMIEAGNTVTEDAGDIWEPSEGISYSGPSCGLECWQAMLEVTREKLERAEQH